MPKIIQLSPHLANLIAAGEVVERPASVVKELLENAVDAGATKVTVELRDGGMTFLRVTDNGCGMTAEDARTAFLRHATSKIRTEEDLAAIGTMGFRGEALAAIASVSRVDLMTKTPGAVEGVSLHLEAGKITEEREAGCPEGTTIIVRDLFFNTPARMKFMKADTVEGGAAASAVQRQALAHPQVAIRLLRDGKEIINTPGDGKLLSAMAGIYGREARDFIPVDSRWEKNTVTGYVTKPTQARASRVQQTFFVNGRPVKSRLLQAALEEAYRNRIMVGRFPACVLHIQVPANAVDVNVHPAKTEVKFLWEREVFDCVHYGVLAALNKTQDRPELQLGKTPAQEEPAAIAAPAVSAPKPQAGTAKTTPKPDTTFRTMTAEDFRQAAAVWKEGPKPEPERAKATLQAMGEMKVAQPVWIPGTEKPVAVTGSVVPPAKQEKKEAPAVHLTLRDLPPAEEEKQEGAKPQPEKKRRALPIAPPVFEPVEPEMAAPAPVQIPQPEPEEAQQMLELPAEKDYMILGELFRTYIVVQQGDEAFLIDKHAAHERILFDRLREQKHEISSQELLTPQVCRLGAEGAAVILENRALLEELGYGVEEFGEGTLMLRRCPMDLDEKTAAECLADLASDLREGRREDRDTLRDNLLHTTACKAAIKAGWNTDPLEREALVSQVLSREDLRYCPHGRPVCIRLTKNQLARQFGRS